MQIFNGILRTTYLPYNKWKRVIIVTKHKPGTNRKDPKRYRPISLLSIFFKLFERFFMPQILNTVEHILPRTQCDFRIGHSGSQQLHRIADVILNAYETKQSLFGFIFRHRKGI